MTNDDCWHDVVRLLDGTAQAAITKEPPKELKSDAVASGRFSGGTDAIDRISLNAIVVHWCDSLSEVSGIDGGKPPLLIAPGMRAVTFSLSRQSQSIGWHRPIP